MLEYPVAKGAVKQANFSGALYSRMLSVLCRKQGDLLIYFTPDLNNHSPSTVRVAQAFFSHGHKLPLFPGWVNIVWLSI